MPGGRRRPVARIGMTAAIEVDVPHAAALAREDDFVPLLDEVHATRIRVDEQASVSAAAATAATRLRHHDVGNPFGMRTRWFGTTPAATPATSVAASTAGDSGQKLRRRYNAAEAVEAAHAVGIDANPIALEPRAGCWWRLRVDRRRADAGQQDSRENNPLSHAVYSFGTVRVAGLRGFGAVSRNLARSSSCGSQGSHCRGS